MGAGARVDTGDVQETARVSHHSNLNPKLVGAAAASRCRRCKRAERAGVLRRNQKNKDEKTNRIISFIIDIQKEGFCGKYDVIAFFFVFHENTTCV